MEFQVIVLAGAHGQMLYPLAESTPKGLLPVANKPVIAYVLEMLEKMGEVFTKGVFLATDEDSAGVLVAYADTYRSFSANRFQVIGIPQDAYGSIGAIRHLAPQIDSDCIVISGDVLMDYQVLNELITKFRLSDAACSMLIQKNSGEEVQLLGFSGDRIVMMTGCVDMEEGISIKRSLMKKVSRFSIRTDFVDAYVYIFRHWVIDELVTSEEITRGGKTSIKNDLMPMLMELAHRPNLVPLSQSATSTESYVNFVIVPEGSFYRRISSIKAYIETNLSACFPITGVGKKGEPQVPVPAALQSTMNNLPNLLTPFYAHRVLKADAPAAAK
jgi:translation initiation factor eIF-2B subunit gamma